MTITINGSGTIAGITAGGLPDAVIQTADIVDLAVTPAKMSQKLTSGTSVASTSGTSIDFTSIPSWVKRITVIFSGVSTNGTSNYLVQVGSGSITSTGYGASSSVTATSSATTNFSTGFGIANNGSAAQTNSGSMTILLVGSNTYVSNHTLGVTNLNNSIFGGGNITLGGTLDRIRVTTVNGTDTFDAGSINIMYEG